MDFGDQLRELAKSFDDIKEELQTEEGVKHSLIMPLIQALGYNVFNPAEVVPEFTADIGIKKGEKVDYAIIINGKPLLLIEAKTIGTELDPHATQLTRYFSATEAKFGILTDGITYQFYSDLDDKNKMDLKPFFILDLTPALRDSEINELKKFHKSYFNADQIASSAITLKYISELKKYLKQQFVDPETDFIKFLIKKIYDKAITSKALENLTPIVKKALSTYMHEAVSDKLQSALNETRMEEKESGEIIEDLGIITTDEEIEAFHIVRAILRQYVPVEKIQYKDTKSYFGILYEGNTRKWVCRFRLTLTQKQIIFCMPDKTQETVEIKSIDDIYNFQDRFKQSLDIAISL